MQICYSIERLDLGATGTDCRDDVCNVCKCIVCTRNECGLILVFNFDAFLMTVARGDDHGSPSRLLKAGSQLKVRGLR